MNAFAASTVATAHGQIRKALILLQGALKAESGEDWKLVAQALGAAAAADSTLQDAMKLESMTDEAEPETEDGR